MPTIDEKDDSFAITSVHDELQSVRAQLESNRMKKSVEARKLAFEDISGGSRRGRKQEGGGETTPGGGEGRGSGVVSAGTPDLLRSAKTGAVGVGNTPAGGGVGKNTPPGGAISSSLIQVGAVQNSSSSSSNASVGGGGAGASSSKSLGINVSGPVTGGGGAGAAASSSSAAASALTAVRDSGIISGAGTAGSSSSIAGGKIGISKSDPAVVLGKGKQGTAGGKQGSAIGFGKKGSSLGKGGKGKSAGGIIMGGAFKRGRAGNDSSSDDSDGGPLGRGRAKRPRTNFGASLVRQNQDTGGGGGSASGSTRSNIPAYARTQNR